MSLTVPEVGRQFPGVGEVGNIPLELIRPYSGQPRRYFDEKSLRELADSIAAEGQFTPAWVMPVDDPVRQFELIAGERRWRACKMAGIPTLRCEVREPENAAEQYIASVMENFGRKDCTVMETAKAVAEVMRIRFGRRPKHGDGAVIEVAKVFARSGAWVTNNLSLLRLHPEVQKLLDPPQRMPTVVAQSLANLRPELQLSLAQEILSKEMRYKSALEFIRGSVTNDQTVGTKGRKRKPVDDYRTLTRFVNGLGEQAQLMLSLPKPRIEAMFANRSAKDLQVMRSVLRRRIADLGRLEALLSEIG